MTAGTPNWPRRVITGAMTAGILIRPARTRTTHSVSSAHKPRVNVNGMRIITLNTRDIKLDEGWWTLDGTPMPMSEDFLADRFAERYKDTLRYVNTWRRWYYWDGTNWCEDATKWHCWFAIAHVRAACYWPEAATLTPLERRMLDSRRSAWSMLELARYDRRIAATAEDVGIEPPVRWRRKKV